MQFKVNLRGLETAPCGTNVNQSKYNYLTAAADILVTMYQQAARLSTYC